MNLESNGIESNRIESNRIKSNQIKSNQIKSNQIKSNQIKSNRIESLLGDTMCVCVRVCVPIGPPLLHTTAILKTKFIMVDSNRAQPKTKAL